MDSSLDLLFNGFLFENQESYGLLIENDFVEKIKNKLRNLKINITASKELTNLDKCSVLYLLVLTGKTNKIFDDIFERCSLYGKKINGFGF